MENCESTNPLNYYKKYSYPACRVENTLIDAAVQCRCKPYTLPKLVKDSYKSKVTCSMYPIPLKDKSTCFRFVY